MMKKNIDKINLRDIDIDMILTSSSFQKKLAENVQIIIINMNGKEYENAIKKVGSKEGLLEKIKKYVITKMIEKITSKLFWGSSIIAMGILSAINISDTDGNTVNLNDIPWEKIPWEKISWEELKIDLDLADAENEIFGEGASNFFSWAKSTAIEWVDNSDYY